MIGSLPDAVRRMIEGLLRLTSVAPNQLAKVRDRRLVAEEEAIAAQVHAANRLTEELRRLESTIVLRPFEVSKDKLNESSQRDT